MKRRPKQFFAVRLDPGDLDRLRKIEARTGETLADQIRRAIRRPRTARQKSVAAKGRVR